jgi:hypothetical protein
LNAVRRDCGIALVDSCEVGRLATKGDAVS